MDQLLDFAPRGIDSAAGMNDKVTRATFWDTISRVLPPN